MHPTWLVPVSLVLFPNIINMATRILSQSKTQEKAQRWLELARPDLPDWPWVPPWASTCACPIGRITVAITKKMGLSIKPCKFSHDRWKKPKGPDAEIASELETGFSHKHEIMKPRFRPDTFSHFLFVQMFKGRRNENIISPLCCRLLDGCEGGDEERGVAWGWNYRRWNETSGDLEMWVGWWRLYIKHWPNQAVSFMGAGSYHSCNSLLTTGVDSKNGRRWDLCLNRWFVIMQTPSVLTASSNGPVSKVCFSIAHLNSLPMQKILNVSSVYWMVDHRTHSTTPTATANTTA